MSVPELSRCEYCGEEHEFLCGGTSFHGNYCEGCIKLSIEQEKEALNDIREQKKAKRKK